MLNWALASFNYRFKLKRVLDFEFAINISNCGLKSLQFNWLFLTWFAHRRGTALFNGCWSRSAPLWNWQRLGTASGQLIFRLKIFGHWYLRRVVQNLNLDVIGLHSSYNSYYTNLLNIISFLIYFFEPNFEESFIFEVSFQQFILDYIVNANLICLLACFGHPWAYFDQFVSLQECHDSWVFHNSFYNVF